MNTFIIFAILAVVAFIIFAFVFMYQLRSYKEPLEQETPEAYPCKHQTPFDDKLIELGVKEKWDENREKDNAIMLHLSSFENFIFTSFTWSITAEGFDFWYEISKK